MNIIDTHSHFGLDYYRGNISLTEYITFANNVGITSALLMPVPNPMTNNEKTLRIFYENGHFTFFPSQNPFYDVNYRYYDDLARINDKNVNLFFVPLIHPNIDSIEYLEKMLLDINPVALKIHGSANCVNPLTINSNFIGLVKDYDITLIVHTHFDKKINTYSEGKKMILSLNAPYNWATFLHNNQIKGVLNHGAYLDAETINLVNQSEYLKIAIGPDKVLNDNPDKLCIEKNRIQEAEYLELLKQLVLPDKLVFDIDYNWNEFDSDTVNRVKQVWNEENQQKIFSQNLLNFNIKIKKRIGN